LLQATRLLATSLAIQERFGLRFDPVNESFEREVVTQIQAGLGSTIYAAQRRRAYNIIRLRIPTVAFDTAYDAIRAIPLTQIIAEVLREFQSDGDPEP
jgi:hypothetical protein